MTAAERYEQAARACKETHPAAAYPWNKFVPCQAHVLAALDALAAEARAAALEEIAAQYMTDAREAQEDFERHRGTLAGDHALSCACLLARLADEIREHAEPKP